MVTGGGDPGGHQRGAHLLDIFAGRTVDDTALIGILGRVVLHPTQPVAGLLDPKIEVFAVKAGDDGIGVLQVEYLQDIAAHRIGGSGGKGGHRRPVGQLLQKLGDLQVAGAEIVAPLGYAVGLVDGQQRYVRRAGKVQKIGGEQSLRRHVDDLIHPVAGILQRPQILGPAQGAV